MLDDLRSREVNGGRVTRLDEERYQLLIPESHQARYHLAQLDDYMHLTRRQFPHKPPLSLQLEARVFPSDEVHGTWGFGFWNDPFSLGFGAGGMSRLMPVLPNAVWFFYGSEENYLSLRNDQPGAGFHVKSLRSQRLPSILSLLALPALPFLLWRTSTRCLRRLSRALVKEDSKSLEVNTGVWHTYAFEWKKERLIFWVDDREVYQTGVSPQGRMGLVIWIDNQYFRFDPQGKIGFGYLQTPTEHRLLVRNVRVVPG